MPTRRKRSSTVWACSSAVQARACSSRACTASLDPPRWTKSAASPLGGASGQHTTSSVRRTAWNSCPSRSSKLLPGGSLSGHIISLAPKKGSKRLSCGSLGAERDAHRRQTQPSQGVRRLLALAEDHQAAVGVRALEPLVAAIQRQAGLVQPLQAITAISSPDIGLGAVWFQVAHMLGYQTATGVLAHLPAPLLLPDVCAGTLSQLVGTDAGAVTLQEVDVALGGSARALALHAHHRVAIAQPVAPAAHALAARLVVPAATHRAGRLATEPLSAGYPHRRHADVPRASNSDRKSV